MDESLRDRLLDELSDEWVNVERAIWPQGPAHGTGSGAYAVLKAKIIDLLAASPANPPDGSRPDALETVYAILDTMIRRQTLTGADRARAIVDDLIAAQQSDGGRPDVEGLTESDEAMLHAETCPKRSVGWCNCGTQQRLNRASYALARTATPAERPSGERPRPDDARREASAATPETPAHREGATDDSGEAGG